MERVDKRKKKEALLGPCSCCLSCIVREQLSVPCKCKVFAPTGCESIKWGPIRQCCVNGRRGQPRDGRGSGRKREAVPSTTAMKTVVFDSGSFQKVRMFRVSLECLFAAGFLAGLVKGWDLCVPVHVRSLVEETVVKTPEAGRDDFCSCHG